VRRFESCRGRRSRHGANLRVRAAWHAEPRYNAVATFDADLVDESLEERLSGRHRAGLETLLDLAPRRGNFVDVRRRQGRLLYRHDQLLAPCTKFAHLGGEPFEALAALGLRQRAGLERREVALDGVLGLGDPGVDDRQFLVVVRPVGARPVSGGRDGFVEEVGALVDVEQRVEDGCVQLLSRQALGVAELGAVALA
jgi:hypothetical protein